MTLATIWDAATAFGTVAMAVTTAIVMRQNMWQRQDIARQHRDAFKPVCVFVPNKRLAGPFDRSDIVQCLVDPNDPLKYFRVTCGVKNIGCGPAMNLRLVMRFSTSKPDSLPRVEIEMLGANQSLPSPIKVPVFLRPDGFNDGNYHFAPGEVWKLGLVYEDVFGSVFHTRHTKNPQQPWASFGKGDINRHD
jgi:hypothetical protein